MPEPKPKFCRGCAKALVSKKPTATAGFDPFTGKAVPIATATLICPARTEPKDDVHDRWETRPDHNNGAWEPWNG